MKPTQVVLAASVLLMGLPAFAAESVKETKTEAKTEQGVAPDNTKNNKRDKNHAEMLPTDQGESKADLKITTNLRKSLMKAKGLSFDAQNVKIITKNGVTTLRGPVLNDAEKKLIEGLATKSGATKLECELEVKGK